MNNFLNLTKIYFLSYFQNIKIKNKKGVKAILLYIGVAILAAALVVSMFFYFYPFSIMLAASGKMEYIFIIGGVTTFFLLLFFNLYQGAALIFKAKDYEMLSALPIKKHEIVLAKLLNLLMVSYFFSAMFLIPCIVNYFVFTSFNVLVLVYFIIAFLVFPVLPLTISLFLGLIVLYFSSKLKNGNIINLVVQIILMLGVIVGMQYITSITNMLIATGVNIENNIWVNILLPDIILFLKAANLSSVWFILLLVAYNLLFGVLTVLVVSGIYYSTNQKLKNSPNTVSKKEIEYKSKKYSMSLIKIEGGKYMNDVLYVLNSSFGLLFMPAIPFLFYFNLGNMLPILSFDKLFVLVIIAFCTIIGTINTANSSISLEGKKFYILKMLPIKTKEILDSKINFNLLLIIPMSVLVSLITVVLFFNKLILLKTIGIVYVVCLFVLPLIAAKLWVTVGLLLNLLMPKMKFQNSMEVVKQSMPVMFTVLGPMVIYFAILYFALTTTLASQVVLSILILVHIILYFVVRTLLNKYGEKLFNKIDG